MDRSNLSLTHLEGEIMAFMNIVIDLAKKVFAAHGEDATGKLVM